MKQGLPFIIAFYFGIIAIFPSQAFAKSERLAFDIDNHISLILAHKSTNIDSSLFYFNEIIENIHQVSNLDSKMIFHAIVETYHVFFDKGDFIGAKAIIDSLLELGYKMEDDLILCRTFLLLANWHLELSNLKESYQYFENAQSYSKKCKDAKTEAMLLSGLALFYSERGERDKEQECYQKAIIIYNEINDTINQAVTFNNLGYFFIESKDYSSALEYSNNALEIFSEENRASFLSSLSQKAEALIFLGEEKLGFELLDSAIHIANRNELKAPMLYINTTKSKCLLAKERYNEAIETAEIAFALSKELDHLSLQPFLTGILSKSNKELKNYKESLFWSEEKIEVSKKLEERIESIEVTKLEAKNELQQKETENQVLVLKNRIQRILLFTLCLIGSAFIILGYILLRRKQRKQFYEFKETVAADLHDDIGSNLNSISRIAKELKSQSNNKYVKNNIDVLVDKTNASIKNIVDVVWSMDTKKSKLGELIEKMEAHLDIVKMTNPNLKIDFIKKNLKERKVLSIKQKHNLLMIFKEAIDNIQEHTNSSEINIEMAGLGSGFRLGVTNHFDSKRNTHDSTGRGLVNIRRRVMELNGQVEIQETKNKFEVIVELKKI